MNTPLPPDPGPFGADTDDAVTALIDGELAGFAAERGLDVESVRASLNAWGGLEARKATLERAVAAMQVPVTLDPNDREAMVAAALAAAPEVAPVVPIERKRRGATVARWLTAAAVLAVLVVGAVGIVRPLSGDNSRATRPTEPAIEDIEKSGSIPIAPNAAGGGSGSTDRNTATTRPLATASPSSVPTSVPSSALGEISNPKTLINKVQPLVPQPLVAPAGTQVTPAAGAAPVPTTGSCSAAGLFPAGAVVVLDTTATFNGKPAEVIAAQLNDRTFVYVLAPSGCSVLSAVSF